MNAKQNMIFFIGVILMIMVFWVNGYWSILKNGISKKPAPATEVPAKNGKCPRGYINLNGHCFHFSPPGTNIGIM